MNKRKYIFAIGTFLFLSIFTYVNIKISMYYNDKASSNKTDEASIISHTVEKEPVIAFREYQKFYEYLSNNIDLKGYEKKYSSNHDYINIVDPTWTFHTRDRLILPDSDMINPTQEYMILENQNSTCQVTIAVCYNQYNIGNNLHTYLFKNSDLKNINQELNKNSVGAVMSYQNILFHVQMCRTHKEDYFLDDVLTELCHKVTEYFDNKDN